MMELDLVISKSMTKLIQQEKEALYINHCILNLLYSLSIAPFLQGGYHLPY